MLIDVFYRSYWGDEKIKIVIYVKAISIKLRYSDFKIVTFPGVSS